MKVCLVIPPSPFLTDDKVFPPLGILRIAAVLEKAGIKVVINGDYTKFNIFGITATTPQIPEAIRIKDEIRRVNPIARIILGGPHVTLMNASKRGVQPEGFDCLVAGDGERAIFHAIGKRFVNADNPKSNLFINDLDSLPFPARHLIDMDEYHYEIDGVRATSIIAQMGCPFKCGFCGGRNSPSMRRMRNRSPENVVREMMEVYETYGIRGFMFYDDELNINRQLIPLLGLIKSQKIDFRLRGFVRADLFNEDQARAMRQAGFRWILVGFESGSPRMLKNMNKGVSVEQNTLCVEIAHKYNLKVKALMSIGHPGESESTVNETRLWLKKVRPDDFDMTIITVYPGTDYYDRAIKDGEFWRYTVNGENLYAQDGFGFYKTRPGQYVSLVHTDYLTSTELVSYRDEIERELKGSL